MPGLFAILVWNSKQFYATCDIIPSSNVYPTYVFFSVHNLLANVGLTQYQCTVVVLLHCNALSAFWAVYAHLCMYVCTYISLINIPFGCFGNGYC